MGKGTIYKVIEFHEEVEFDVDEVIGDISDEDLMEEVKSRGLNKNDFVSNGISASTLYDDLKINLLKEAYAKYTLEELEQKLK